MSDVARVVSLHRYPVKALVGESLDAVDLDLRGVRGDRLWSVRTDDAKIGSGKTTRRFTAVPGLLLLRSRTEGGGITVTLPDGQEVLADSPDAGRRLSDVLGQPVTLATETDVTHFDDGPVSLLGTASVAALAAAVGAPVDPARFRSNILVDGLPPYGEEQLVGELLQLGTAELEVTMRSTRCVMVDMETAALPPQRGNLRALGELHEACLGVIARVTRPGRVAVGDTLRIS